MRTAIERLFATRRYQDIQVDVTQVSTGVAVRFITKNSWFVGHVGVQADFPEPPSPSQIVSAARLDLGSPFDQEQLPASEENIRKLLVGDGYFDPEVSHRLDYDKTYQQVKITFLIDTGKRARYDTPEITGDTSVLSQIQIIKASHWRRFLFPGYRGITEARTLAGMDNIRLKYENVNRLRATVSLRGFDVKDPPGRAAPRIAVNPGPAVEVKAEGANISRKALKQNVPIFEEHSVDTDLLTEGSVNLRDYFQSRGYFEVEVEYREQQEQNGKTEIDYLIHPGIRHRLLRVEIQGNRYFETKTIRERMFLVPASFELPRGRYSEAYRRRDEETIVNLYRANGFQDVKVTSRVVDDYQGRKGDYAVFFTIEEGAQYRVESLQVIGAEKLDLKRILPLLSSQEGQVFSEFNVATDRETIIQEYGKNGFANAAFEWDAKPGSQPQSVDLRFEITEGEQQFVRQVVVDGTPDHAAQTGEQVK